ncbi:MAG: hypothetical protein GX998_00105 [Firmicutes bacterium]|nr:hypothetical protein [Bacillota bacterium]
MKSKRIIGLLALLALTLTLAGCTVSGTVHLTFQPQDVVELTLQDAEVYRRWYGADPHANNLSFRVYVRDRYVGTIPRDGTYVEIPVGKPRFLHHSLRFDPSKYRYPPDIRIEVWDHGYSPRDRKQHVDDLFIPYRAWQEQYTSGKYVYIRYSVRIERR